MNGIAAFWQSVTEPQAIILSAGMTILAAILGVLLGASLFGSRVRDMESALDKMEDRMRTHREKIESALVNIEENMGALDEQIGTSMQKLGQVQGSMDDLQRIATEDHNDDRGATVFDISPREQMRDTWVKIRDKIESIAADPGIDGRTRARYARIDRRKYSSLIDALSWDRRLGANQNKYKEAVDIWNQYRSGRRVPASAHLARMEELSRELGA